MKRKREKREVRERERSEREKRGRRERREIGERDWALQPLAARGKYNACPPTK